MTGTVIPAPKTGSRPSKAPQKRPAHTSHDTSMHPPKKQRLESANGVAKVAVAGTGARATAKVKRKDGVDKVVGGGHGAVGKGLIETAPATTASTSETAPPAHQTESIGGTTAAGDVAQGKEASRQNATSRQSKSSKTSEKTVVSPIEPQPSNKTIKIPSKSNNTSTSKPDSTKQLHTARRMPPQKPLTSDGQHVLGRPKDASGSGPTRAVDGRDVVFVTRKTGLGSYMRRCKALLVDDGYVCFPFLLIISFLIRACVDLRPG